VTAALRIAQPSPGEWRVYQGDVLLGAGDTLVRALSSCLDEAVDAYAAGEIACLSCGRAVPAGTLDRILFGWVRIGSGWVCTGCDRITTAAGAPCGGCGVAVLTGN
jgi:hypothetical protein